MMDKMTEPKNFPYQKKIISYLDGSLSPDDRSEFEAYIRTNPEFESQIKMKEKELLLLKSYIPSIEMSSQALESLEGEMKLSIFNLLKEEPKGLLDRVKISWEDWINR